MSTQCTAAHMQVAATLAAALIQVRTLSDPTAGTRLEGMGKGIYDAEAAAALYHDCLIALLQLPPVPAE